MLKRKILTCLVLAIAISFPYGGRLIAADYPSKPVKVMVPFDPGGGSDRQARLIEGYFKDEFGQPLVYVYKPGAGGAIGAYETAVAKADGYTIGVHTFPTLVMQPLTSKAEFTMEDFAFLGQSTSEVQMLLVLKDSPYDTLASFVKAAKEKPERLTVGIVTSFGPEHIDTLKLMEEAGIKVTIVPFGGGSKGLAGLLGKQVDALMGYSSAVKGELSKMRILAVSTRERTKEFADAPTFVEQGYDVVSIASRIWIAPAGLPADVKARLISGLKKIYANPDVVALAEKTAQPVDWLDGEAVRQMVMDYQTATKRILQVHGMLKN